MSEETKVVETEVVEQAPAEPVVSPTEAAAREQGWVSKEEWVDGGGDPNEWRTAKEFVDRGELYKSLHSIKRELKQERAAREALTRHHQYVFDMAHKKALNELKQQRRMAIREGDAEYADEIEEQIEAQKQEYAAQRHAIAQNPVQATPAEFENFVERNPWYVSDETLRDEADAIGFVYLNKKGDPSKLFQHVEKKMKEKFPDKFGGVRKTAPNPTAAADRTVRASKNDIVLDEFEQEIMKTLVKSGTMTEAEYKAELKKAKGIK